MADDANDLVKLALTAVTVILMVPGLLIEPGPITEIVGIGFIAAIWGIDSPVGGDD